MHDTTTPYCAVRLAPLLAALASVVCVAACGDSVASEPDPGSIPTADGGATRADAANSPDASNQGPADGSSAKPGDFGTQVGEDPCVPKGTAPLQAWFTHDRCYARTRRSTIVSTHTGAIERTLDLGTPGSPYADEALFGSDGTTYAEVGTLTAFAPKTYSALWKTQDVNYTLLPGAPDTLFTSVNAGFSAATTAYAPNGSQLWQRADSGTEIAVLPNGDLARCDYWGNFHVERASDGKTVWAPSGQDLGTAPIPPLRVSSEGVVFAAHDHKIAAISTSLRKRTWSITVQGSPTNLAIDERSKRLYFIEEGESGGSPARIGAVNQDGTGLVYSTTTFVSPYGALSSKRTELALGDDGWVYVNSPDGMLVAVQLGSANHWEAPLPYGGLTSAPVVAGDGTIYVAGIDASSSVSVTGIAKSGSTVFTKILGAATYKGDIYHPAPGIMVSIAPTGHLAVSTNASGKLYLLGP